jgi:predicted lipoprotein with Yx(FWY)xxD motif
MRRSGVWTGITPSETLTQGVPMPPSADVPQTTRRKRRHRLVAGATTLGLSAAIALAFSAAPVAATTSAKTKALRTPVELSVFSPGASDTAGIGGSGFVVDLALTARNKASNTFLSPDAGYKPFFNNPSAPTFVPGPNGGAPGLVVMLSTTPDVPGTAFHGPNTNLAGLFQINGVGSVNKGLIQTWNTWQIGKAGFGTGPSTLTAFVVKGTAPAIVRESEVEVISNKVKVSFTITAPATATPAPAAANATVKIATDPKLGDLLVDANGRTLYQFEKDQGTTSACTGACASTWPAFKPAGTPTVGTGLDATKIGSAGGQVTYAGHLLYYYAGDAKAGDTFGAAIPSWGAVSPSGTSIHAS